MKTRIVALLLLAAAALLHLGFTRQERAAAAAAQDTYRRAREARRGVTQRLAAAERGATARERLRAVLAGAQAGPGDDVARLRRDAIAAANGAGVSGVRLEVARGRPPAAASLALSAHGSLPAVTALARDLPLRRAVVLESARLEALDEGLAVELRGVRPGGGS
ncbi:MAG TPA: hypothetical protein VFM88_21475 [Vicinamibacteria bacterium]|nr:hypothetical protein [Vicinamibacteria bacterium]